MPRIDYAPDGENYHTIKRGGLGKLWDYFVTDREMRIHLIMNPQARFRLFGEGQMIGILAYDAESKEILHLGGN